MFTKNIIHLFQEIKLNTENKKDYTVHHYAKCHFAECRHGECYSTNEKVDFSL